MAIVGPHGSALLNMHWAAPGALVLEVFAAGQRGNEEYWLIAAGLGHNYWSLPVGAPSSLCCHGAAADICNADWGAGPQRLVAAGEGAASTLRRCCSRHKLLAGPTYNLQPLCYQSFEAAEHCGAQ